MFYQLMILIDEANEFYKNSYILNISNIFYNYINYVLCIVYICWFPINIIINNNLTEFANENYINYYLIFYAFNKMYLILKNNKYIIYDIISSIIFLLIIGYDIINHNNIHQIQYWIFYNLLFSICIFVNGTMYLIFSLDFHSLDNYFDKEIYLENIADITSDNV